MKFGRRRPIGGPGPHLKLAHYLKASLPAAPRAWDLSSKAMPAIQRMYLNDQLGCCVIAGGYHVTGALTANSQATPFIASDDQIVADYGAIGGYVPGNAATDQGCDEPTAFRYWTEHGFANGTKLLAWMAVDATNVAEVQSALWLFGNLFHALELPNSGDFERIQNGFKWDVVQGDSPDSNKGHAVIAPDLYTETGVGLSTWAMLGEMTYEAMATYCVPSAGGALYVLVSPDELARGQSQAPNGVDWVQLLRDANTLGGNVVIPPGPSPTPPPSPNPVGPVAGLTLAQAQAAGTQGVNGQGHFLLTRGQAVSAVQDALAKAWPPGAS